MLSLRSIFSHQSHSRQRERMLRRLSMTVLVCSISLWAVAQTKPAAPAKKVYTYVEQMPQLTGGGGMQAIINDFQKRVHLPKSAVEQGYDRAIVHFEVGPDGNVRHIKILDSSNSPAFDAEILAVVRAFPRFIPGRQNGKPVAVSFNLPVTICAQ